MSCFLYFSNENQTFFPDANFFVNILFNILGYRDDSLESVKRNQEEYNIPLTVLSYKDLYGWTMDDIVKQVGRKNNCTFCGVFRRQALDRGAILLKCDVIATGHNADDVAETILMNLLRGDIARLQRCTFHITVSCKVICYFKLMSAIYYSFS